MVARNESTRELMPGTTGWSVDDLDDPDVRRQWDAGRFEIVYGVIAKMPAAFFDHGAPLGKLIYLLEDYFGQRSETVYIGTEVDIVLDRRRVFIADAVLLTEQDLARQRAEHRPTDAAAGRVGSLVIPPTLIIESISEGHESHDAEFKRQQYAEFGAPNYWLVNYKDRSLECLRLRDTAYEEDTQAQRGDNVAPAVFPGLEIPLDRLFI